MEGVQEEAKEPVGIEDNKYINVLFLIIHPSYNYKLCSPQCFKNICQNTVFKEQYFMVCIRFFLEGLAKQQSTI